MRTLFILGIAVGCGSASDFDMSAVGADRQGLCAPREPGFVVPTSVTRNGQRLSFSALSANERSQVQQTTAYFQGHFGPPSEVVECTLSITNIGSSYRCTDKVSGKSCSISIDIGGPSAGCDDPSHPTC